MAAVLQRTAKKAPKLASVISKFETKPINPTDVNDSFALPRSSDSKWWLQLQTDYMYQSDQVNPLENRHDGSINIINSLSSKESYEFVKMDSVEIPWWQVGETDDLGSFVSKKSRILVESCDLYQPVHAVLEPQKVECGQSAVSRGVTQNYASKGKILEALCHSQTRAREAEISAKKANEEKEHAIKLLLRQAAQLFAYRQWIYVLQIENLCYQMKYNKSDLISSVGAFSSSKIGKLDKNLKTVGSTKGKRIRTERGIGRYERGLGKYAVVFVVGLGIVGAGLVLGWTIGWMLI